MIGYKLTAQQAVEISGNYFNDATTFNPIQDINGEWFIFEGEVNGFITVEEFNWVKTLQPSEYVPPINTNTP
jgi:hypothetical protein